MQNPKQPDLQEVRHLAARTVMAYRAGFPIMRVSASTVDTSANGILCDWKQLRSTGIDDDRLLRRAFAFIYIGTIIDQGTEPLSKELQNELASDMSSSLDARETAVAWGLAPSINDTNPFAHSGYKLASRLLRADRELIDALALALSASPIMDQEQLLAWFDLHATPLHLEELEQVTTY